VACHGIVGAMARDDLLVWIDLEMTGLDPERSAIVEIATVVTDGALSIVAEGPNLVIHQPPGILEQMDDYVRNMHQRSGLIDRIAASEIGLAEAEERTLAFVATHCQERTSPLCGNSIWKDRQFIERYMPRLDRHLHYRCIDVSSLKELTRRWYPERFSPPEKKETHRALDDIRESIEELRWYRATFFS
jgi:oligoribonuclease